MLVNEIGDSSTDLFGRLQSRAGRFLCHSRRLAREHTAPAVSANSALSRTPRRFSFKRNLAAGDDDLHKGVHILVRLVIEIVLIDELAGCFTIVGDDDHQSIARQGAIAKRRFDIAPRRAI